MDERQNTPARWTIKDVLEWTAGYFRKKGITTARLDAEVLLAHCLGVDRLHLYLNLDRPLRHEERVRYRELIRRRAMREPVALIRGVKEFWSLRLRATPGVLIPRPDTETLVEAVSGRDTRARSLQVYWKSVPDRGQSQSPLRSRTVTLRSLPQILTDWRSKPRALTRRIWAFQLPSTSSLRTSLMQSERGASSMWSAAIHRIFQPMLFRLWNRRLILSLARLSTVGRTA